MVLRGAAQTPSQTQPMPPRMPSSRRLTQQQQHQMEHTQPRIISISDCEPATYVLNAATSGEPTMRDIVCESRHFTRYWLGVAVPREANSDADILSHPETAWQLVPGKTNARVHRIEVPYWALVEVELRLRDRAQYWAADHSGYF